MTRELALLAVLVACDAGAKKPATTGSAGSAVLAIGSARDAAVAVADAALPDAAPLDAGSDTVTMTVPDFGCFAWSPARRLVACYIGARGNGIGPSSVDLAFAAVGSDAADVPDTIHVLAADGGRGDDELDAKTSAAIELALRTFVPLPTASKLEGAFEGKRWSGALALGHGRKIVARVVADPYAPPTASDQDLGGGSAPRYHVVVTAPFAAGSALDDQDAAISRLTVEAAPVGGAFAVDEIYSIADEGEYGSFGIAWLCSASACDSIQ